jgi:hypothetical protein
MTVGFGLSSHLSLLTTKFIYAILFRHGISGSFDSTGRIIPPVSGWAVLPEVVAAERLRSSGADDVAVRILCTFTSAMDRARDAKRLWRNAAELFLREDWVFDPQEIQHRGYDALRDVLRAAGVSQRHGPDSLAWLRIGRSLEDQRCAPEVYQAVYQGKGETGSLLSALRAKRNGQSLFPFLRGPKISLMWVRMLVYPGQADIANIEMLPVAVDAQVRKVTEYLGLTSTRGMPLNKTVRYTIQDAWQRNIEMGGSLGPSSGSSLDNTAASLDPAIWYVGSWGCTTCEKRKQKLPIAEFCRDCKLQSE